MSGRSGKGEGRRRLKPKLLVVCLFMGVEEGWHGTAFLSSRRRPLLLHTFGAGAGLMATSCTAESGLAGRLTAKELQPLESSLSPFEDRELYYPQWLFGTWRARAMLKSRTFPFGEDKALTGLNCSIPKGELNLHYYSTLADNFENQIRVGLGLGIPRSKVIADRIFNLKSASRTHASARVVSEVTWDPSYDPTRLTLNFDSASSARVSSSQEIQIATRSSQTADNGAQATFWAAERFVVVDKTTDEFEIITEYNLKNSDAIEGRGRIAFYPSDSGIWFQVGGKATALLDFTFTMQRLNQSTPYGDVRSCVDTPKGYTQCVGGLVYESRLGDM